MAGNGSNRKIHVDEQGLVFPCDFPFKMLGKNNQQFIEAAHAVIANHIPREEWVSSKESHSRNENYLSCTVIICVQNRQQLDDIISDINKCPEIIVAL